MQDWSGGNWRHFLQKYHESRDICDEVLRVREIVSSRAAQNSKAEKTPYEREIEREKIARATDLVLQAQSNDPLWHGAFGGLYLRHLRQALYAKTTEAQLLVDPETPFARVQCEKNGDWTLENELMRIGVRALGGQISNWTSKAARHNLLSTLRRYREPYYAPNAPEDWHARAALLDHFLGDATTIESFAQSKFSEQGDFVSELWQIETRCGALTASVSDSASVSLRREGGVWFGGVHQPLSICKTLTLRAASDRVEIEYSIRNNSDVKLDIWWANEWNIALSGTDAPTRHFHGDDHKKQHRLDENAQFQEVSSPVAADDWLRLRVQWNFKPNPALWHVPIWSVSQREDGETERSHQSSAFVFHRRLHLMPKTEHLWKFTAGLH